MGADRPIAIQQVKLSTPSSGKTSSRVAGTVLILAWKFLCT